MASGSASIVLAIWAGVVVLSAGRSNRGSYHPPQSYLPVGNSALSTVADILEFYEFYMTGSHRLRRMCPLQCLDACHFISTDQVNPLGIQAGCVFVELADKIYLLAEFLWVIGVSVEPVTI